MKGIGGNRKHQESLKKNKATILWDFDILPGLSRQIDQT